MRTFPFIILALLLAAPAAGGEIFRCQTADGLVFSDRPCGDEAVVVTIEEQSAGITPGPPEEVREYLAQKRDEREEERAERRRAAREAAARGAPSPVITVEQPAYPAWWGPSPYPPQRPRPPHNRPRPQPPLLPLPEPLPPADSIDLRRR